MARSYTPQEIVCKKMASVSVTEDFSSDSDLNENDLDQLVTAQIPTNTQNSTRWAIKTFEGKCSGVLLYFWFLFHKIIFNNMS